MKMLNSSKKRLVLSGFFMAVILLGGRRANADFTFGEPTNLGPKVNSTAEEWDPSISGDGLTLYFSSRRSGGYGDYDLWMATRQTVNDDWSEAINLGPTVNNPGYESAPDISADGLSLFFSSRREGSIDLYVVTRPGKEEAWRSPIKLGPGVNGLAAESEPCISADSLSLFLSNFPLGPFRSGGYGKSDIWLTTRSAVSDPWNPDENIGPLINTSYQEGGPSISSDGLILFFWSDRPGGSGYEDVWFTRRSSTTQDWQSPIWLGPNVNHSSYDCNPDVSSDGRTLYLTSDRTGSIGSTDLWQVSIDPIVDFNGDGIVDASDMCIVVDNWGTDNQLCDIGPMPWGDGVVDVQDLIVLAEHLFEEFPPVE